MWKNVISKNLRLTIISLTTNPEISDVEQYVAKSSCWSKSDLELTSACGHFGNGQGFGLNDPAPRFAYVFQMIEGTMTKIKIRPTADEQRPRRTTEERSNFSDLRQIPMVCLKYTNWTYVHPKAADAAAAAAFRSSRCGSISPSGKTTADDL